MLGGGGGRRYPILLMNFTPLSDIFPSNISTFELSQEDHTAYHSAKCIGLGYPSALVSTTTLTTEIQTIREHMKTKFRYSLKHFEIYGIYNKSIGRAKNGVGEDKALAPALPLSALQKKHVHVQTFALGSNSNTRTKF